MTYFKIATFSPRTFTFVDGKTGYATEEFARAAAEKMGGGTYRISTVTDAGRVDGQPFEVQGPVKAEKRPAKRAGGLNTISPLAGRPH